MQISKKQELMPRCLIIEDTIKDTDLARRIVKKFPAIPTVTIPDSRAITEKIAEEHSGQNALLLAKQQGPFLRLCPGTGHHICCQYYNLDVVEGCDLNCSYCILQGYLNHPFISIFCNIHDLYAELDAVLKKHSRHFYRIGTGELGDSLTFEPIMETAPDLVNYFSDKKNAIIELKTKSVNIEGLLGLEHNRRTVVSWSVNSPTVALQEEGSAPAIEERLRAANEISNAGYRLGFHFDPMIFYLNWQEEYRYIVERIFSVIKPEKIAWISLGALRYPHFMDSVIRSRHPDSSIVLGELFPGKDHKLRYFKPIRIEMFSRMYRWIRSHSAEVFVYLCMESDEVWHKSFGWSPAASAKLKKLLDRTVL